MARRQIRTLTPTELARVQQGALVRIVDDDDSLRDALRFVLETEGWRVADYRSANDFFRGDRTIGAGLRRHGRAYAGTDGH